MSALLIRGNNEGVFCRVVSLAYMEDYTLSYMGEPIAYDELININWLFN